MIRPMGEYSVGDSAPARRWRESLRTWSLALQNVFFPIFCKACGVALLDNENGFFCPACWAASPRIERPFCTFCGCPHPEAVGLGSRSNFPCAECRDRPNPYIRRIYGAALFDGPLADAVKWFKFHNKTRLVRPLGEVMSDFAQREMDTNAYALLTPVPLHRVRERDRGFNQSRLLAEAIIDTFPHAVIDTSLRRIRPTRTQSRLTGEARLSNVRGAFAVTGDSCQGKTILLIDDVVTTCGTVTECARALRRAGAKAVDVLAVALAAHHKINHF